MTKSSTATTWPSRNRVSPLKFPDRSIIISPASLRRRFVCSDASASYPSFSRATAFREIDHLMKLGIIKQNPGRGRSASYELNWEEM